MSLNDVITPLQAVNALATVALPGTRLQTVNGTVLINQRAQALMQQAHWPMLACVESSQSTGRIEWRTWQTKLAVLCVYADRYDQQAGIPIDTIWASIDADLRIMKANIENNPRLVISGAMNALDIAEFILTPYQGEMNTTDYPVPVIERILQVHLNLPPYTSTG